MAPFERLRAIWEVEIFGKAVGWWVAALIVVAIIGFLILGYVLGWDDGAGRCDEFGFCQGE